MPFCQWFSLNYGSLVILCCLARSVYIYRNPANSMSPFSLHRHPVFLPICPCPVGFAIHVLYTEQSTYAYFDEKNQNCRDPFQLHWHSSGLFQTRPENISPWFTLLFLFLWAQRSESYNSRPDLLEMPHLKNTVEISFCPSCDSSKHSILTQIKMTFPKVLLTCVIPRVLCFQWYRAHIVPLCQTTADGAHQEKASLMWSVGNNLLDALKRQ